MDVTRIFIIITGIICNLNAFTADKSVLKGGTHCLNLFLSDKILSSVE